MVIMVSVVDDHRYGSYDGGCDCDCDGNNDDGHVDAFDAFIIIYFI